jgi:cell wall-associated NlpC family hydrolase
MTYRVRFALPFLVLAAMLVWAGAASAAVQKGEPPPPHPRPVPEQTRIVRFARRFVGVRYVYGGTSPVYGFDCSGFTRFVYAHFGIVLPHYSGSQFAYGRSVARSGLRPGDLVFFDALGHVGIYVGHGRFIHAPHTGTRVSVDSLDGWYGTEFDGARRLV